MTVSVCTIITDKQLHLMQTPEYKIADAENIGILLVTILFMRLVHPLLGFLLRRTSKAFSNTLAIAGGFLLVVLSIVSQTIVFVFMRKLDVS